MDRGFLEGIFNDILTKGKVEKEHTDNLLDKYHEAIKEFKDSAEKVKTLEAETTSLKEQISQRDKDLKELKKVDAKELETKIAELEEKNKTMQETHDKEMSETRKNLMIENALMKKNAKNSKAVRGMLDLDKITVDGDVLNGFDEQIEALEQSDSYLFNIEEPTKTIDLGSGHSNEKVDDNSFERRVMGLSTE